MGNINKSEKDDSDLKIKKEDSEKKREEENVPYYKLFKYSTLLDKTCIAFGIICACICGAGQPYMLVLFGEVTGEIVTYSSFLYNKTLNESDWERLNDNLYSAVEKFAILNCVIGIVTVVTTYLSGVLLTYSATRQIFLIRKLFLKRTLNQDINWYDLHQTGDFASTFTENLAKIEDGIGEKIGIFLFFESTFVVGVIFALVRGWKLALVCMASLPVSSIIMGLITFVSTKFSKQELESYATAGAVAEEVLSSVRTVVAFDGQEQETKRYKNHLISAKNNNIKRSFFNSLSNGILWFFTFGSCALSFWYGVGLIIEERDYPKDEQVYDPGNVIAVFFSALTASWNFGMGTPFLEVFGTAKGAAYKIFSVLDNEPVVNKSKTTGKCPTSFQVDIEFKDVHFSYPSRPDVKILQGLNLRIKSGETVALVGSSGCGKSTCIQLIQRFYDPLRGSITLDEYDIKDLNLNWIRNKIGVVGQEPALFAMSISENIRLGKLTATQEEIEHAAIKANAHKFILNLPQGYKTVIGERGAQLSGGQKQRIAIARALVRNPDILLLDEATSALDTTSEAEVQAALDSIYGDCTTIIVAHRLSTIRKANRIVFISQGKVIEEGTHAELMKSEGEYFKLVTSQGFSKENEDEEHPKDPINQNVSKTVKISEFAVDDENNSKILKEKETEKGSLLKILKISKPDWFYVVLGCAASIASGASLPIYALVFGDIVGVFAYESNQKIRDESNIYCLYFLLIGVGSGVAMFFQMFSFCVAGEKLTLRIRNRTFRAMLNQEMSWFDEKENSVGALCTRLSGDAASVQGAGGVRIGTILNSLSTFLISCTFALYYDWKLALVLLSFAPLILLSIFFEQRVIQGDSQKNQKILENSAKIAVEAIGNIRTVVSLACENVFYDKYVNELVLYQKVAKRKCHFRALILGLARSLMLFAYAAGIGYGASLIVSRTTEYAVVFKVCETVITGSWSIGNALSFSPNFQEGLNAANRIFALLERQPLVKNITNSITNTWNKTNIGYSKVYFSYPSRPSISVLNGIDLSVLEGNTVALVGSSGCGKSTIVQLLERFYDPTAGEINIDGNDTKMIDLKVLRSEIGIVSQEPNLFNRTISENIKYGALHKNLSMEEVITAAKIANVHNFISSLPLGYETNIGDKGGQLSGGQKQRIAIARALVRNPRILLLDEATSALDSENEKIVQEALDNAKKGRTCITIAHRLTTIKDADVICVLSDGHVVEIGKHSELLSQKGLYYKFYKLQSNI